MLEDPEWNGFQRLGSVLTLSATHIEKYMTAAEVVLDEAYPEKKVEYLDLSRRSVEMRPGQAHYERLEKAGLLDKVYAGERRAMISTDRAMQPPSFGMPPDSSDTVYLCTADGEGNACSFINSLYMGFGTGIVAGLMPMSRSNCARSASESSTEPATPTIFLPS